MNNINIKISLITVVRNRSKTIEHALKSVINQDYENIEYIVIDGASSDGTKEIIEKYKKNINFFSSEKDKNLYDALNKGLKEVSGDLIGFLHSDDVYKDSNVISRVATCFLDNPNSDLICGGIHYMNGKKKIREVQPMKLTMLSIFKGNLPPHPAIFFSPKVMNEIGFFDDSLEVIADLDWCIRVAKTKKFNTKKINDFFYLMEIGGESSLRMNNLLKRAKEYALVSLKYNPLLLFAFFLKGIRKFLKV